MQRNKKKYETSITHPNDILIQSNISRYQQRIEPFPNVKKSEAEQIAMIAEEQENYNANIKHHNESTGHSNGVINQQLVKQEENYNISKGDYKETIKTSFQQSCLEMEEIEKNYQFHG